MSGKPEIRVAPAQPGWAMKAADIVRDLSTKAIGDHRHFLFALSGGSTPERLYKILASEPYSEQVDWSRTSFFFGDERCVSPDDPDSNYRLANQTLFAPLKISPDHIYRMKGEAADPEAAALDYERQLLSIDSAAGKEPPRFDLVLLGLGEDGHTASLFPGTQALCNRHRLVTVGQSPKGVPKRLTLTLSVINQASVVLFLAIGANKAGIVKRILEPEAEPDRQLPAAMIIPRNGRLIWLLDEPAATLLSRSL